jgi:hypothetical protein
MATSLVLSFLAALEAGTLETIEGMLLLGAYPESIPSIFTPKKAPKLLS